MPQTGSRLTPLLVVVTLAQAVATAQAPPQNRQGVYRSAVVLVPVDVRVIETNTGMPVTDLRQEDFTVFEDDVPQEIRHFTRQSFGPVPRDRAPAGAAARPEGPAPGTSAFSLVPQTRRVFLIVLARGRLQSGPAKALDAAAHFVRDLPASDHVSVFGYDRATDFSTDHEQAALVIERFKAENDAITAALAQQQGGLAAIYGSRELPASVQERINRIFKGTGSLPYGPAWSGADRQTPEVKQDIARQIDKAADAVIAAGRQEPVKEGGDETPRMPAGGGWESFDGFAARNMQTLDDTQNLYAAIAYMQRLEGEKHLVFLTPFGVSLRRLEDYERISAMAADARVAIDVVQTGMGEVLQMRAMRTLSEDTGGVSSIAEYGQQAFDRVDLTTRTGYLIGYYPSNSKRNGETRRIRIVVNRPGVTVRFRRSYRASEELPTFDRRDYMTEFRMRTAATYPREIKDIAVKMQASVAQEQGRFQVTVDALIDASRLAFTLQDGQHVGRLEVALVFQDDKRSVLGGQSRTIAAKIAPERFAAILKEGLKCTMSTTVPSGTRYVRLIVYDYDADLVGTAGAAVF